MRALQMISGKDARKWMWVGLLAVVALRMYFVQEMLAALMLFTGVFAILATMALALYLMDWAGQWSFNWAGRHTRPALQMARRGWVSLEYLSKKPFRHPRSEPVQ